MAAEGGDLHLPLDPPSGATGPASWGPPRVHHLAAATAPQCQEGALRSRETHSREEACRAGARREAKSRAEGADWAGSGGLALEREAAAADDD